MRKDVLRRHQLAVHSVAPVSVAPVQIPDRLVPDGVPHLELQTVWHPNYGWCSTRPISPVSAENGIITFEVMNPECTEIVGNIRFDYAAYVRGD